MAQIAAFISKPIGVLFEDAERLSHGKEGFAKVGVQDDGRCGVERKQRRCHFGPGADQVCGVFGHAKGIEGKGRQEDIDEDHNDEDHLVDFHGADCH